MTIEKYLVNNWPTHKLWGWGKTKAMRGLCHLFSSNWTQPAATVVCVNVG